MAGEVAFGPRTFDFNRLSPEQFQELCFLLARAEFPDVIQPAAPDGGLDAFRPGSTVATAERGWQAKRFTRGVAWPQCVQAARTALARYNPSWITFCFPFDLTERQQRQFVKQLVEAFPQTKFDWWGRSELQSRLISSAAGGRIANYLFGEPEGGRQETLRAIEAGGDLRTANHALKRMVPIGDFFRSSDPYFSYQVAHRNQGDPPSTPAPGTVMRVEVETDEWISLVDVRPAVPEALERHGPAGRLVFSGIEGHHALKKLHRLQQRGGKVTLGRGVRWHWDRVPPALRDLFDPVEEGTFWLAAEPVVPVLRLAFVATTDRAHEEMDFELIAAEHKPRGWDVALEDTQGGLTLTLLVKGEPPTVDMRLNWRWTMDDSPATEQAEALAFADALYGQGTLELLDRASGQRPAAVPLTPGPPDPAIESAKRLFDAIVELEKWTGRTFAIPESISSDEATAIVWAARLIAGVRQTWTAAQFDLDRRPEEAAHQGGALQMRRSYALQVLGEEVELGEEVTYLTAYVIDSVEPRGDGSYLIHIKPSSPTGEALVRLERTSNPADLAS